MHVLHACVLLTVSLAMSFFYINNCISVTSMHSMGFNFFCIVSVPHLFRDIKITGETGAKLYTIPLCEAAKFTQSYCRYSTYIFYSSLNTPGVNSTLIVCDPDDIG